MGTVESAIPNDGTYYACLTKKTAAVRVINYPKVRCARGQKLIKWSEQGPAGAQGPQGPAGPAAPADWNAVPNIPAGFADGADNEGVTAVKVTRETGSAVTIANGANGDAWATCPAGSVIVGGGFRQLSYSVRITDSIPELATNSWRVWGHHTGIPSTSPTELEAFAVCLSVEPSGALTTAKKGVLPAKVKKALRKRDR